MIMNISERQSIKIWTKRKLESSAFNSFVLRPQKAPDPGDEFPLKNFTILLFISLLGIGCSLNASIQALNQSTTEILTSTQTEIAPASDQNSYSLRGYEIQASVGHQGAEVETVTTRGFHVISGVQGTILKE